MGYVTDDGVLVVETTDVGTGAALRVSGGDAAPLLGLPVDSLATGKDSWIELRDGKNQYRFIDARSSEDTYYKVRARNSTNDNISEFSQYFSIGRRLGLNSSDLVLGRVDLVQTNGKPLIHQSVRVSGDFTGRVIGDKVLAGSDQVQQTNLNGRVEFVLVRGEKVTVAIPGTNLVRDITVPEDETIEVFNLMDPTIADNDIFVVQTPNIIMAERRSL
jgi:hypothetical protein